MSTQTVEAPAANIHDTGDKLRHIYCVCDNSHGLCGAPRNKPLSALIPYLGGDHLNRCVVCAEMAPQPCPGCGA